MKDVSLIQAKPLSVSALSAQIKSLLEATFLNVCVEGEISNFTHHRASGHLYFSIKDERALIKCVMFKGNAKRLRFSPEDGAKVIVYGGINVFEPRGDYQVSCLDIIPSGQGGLLEKYEALKKRLESKGYFSNKKPLPPFPRKIAILTSLSGAALQDMRKVAAKRWNLTKLVAIDTLVQGNGAAESIAKNIAYADSFFGSEGAFDIIVIGRGGGSMEDLWAFNEEVVAESIFNARTPIVSAVGHEIDFVISDFVADLRAPTPSACMEMILPDSKEWLLRLGEMWDLFDGAFMRNLANASREIENLNALYKSISYESKMALYARQIIECKENLDSAFLRVLGAGFARVAEIRGEIGLESIFRTKGIILESLKNALEARRARVQRHYAQILLDNKPASLSDIKEGDEIGLCDEMFLARARIVAKEKI